MCIRDSLTTRRGTLCSVAPVFDAPTAPTPGAALDWLARHSGVNEVSGPRWAINGWYAADHHGLRSIADLNRKPVTIVTDGSLMERMERWKCVAADPRDGLFIIETTNDTSVLDACLLYTSHHRTAAATITELAQLLEHLLTRAGNPSLMTDGLKHSLVEHACGNRRSLVHLADQLLDAALEDPACATIDESLFARVMRAPVTGAGAGAGAGTARARKAL